MFYSFNSIHPLQMIFWLASLGSLCMLVYGYIIRPLNDRRKIHNQYDQIMIDKDAICVILISYVNGIESMPNSCYVIAYDDYLKIVTVNNKSKTITIPFDKIQSYSLETQYSSIDQVSEKKRIAFYSESAAILTLYLNNQKNYECLFLGISHILSDEIAFNKYALTQNNFYDYIATKIPIQTQNIEL